MLAYRANPRLLTLSPDMGAVYNYKGICELITYDFVATFQHCED